MLKHDAVKQYIIQQAQLMNPNERIMSRNALVAKLGYSRATIDMAIEELIAEKVLYTKVGSGTFLSEAYRSGLNRVKDDIVSWGVILPDLVKDGYPQFVRGIEDYSRERNINIVVCNTDSDLEKQHSSILRMAESGVHGIIIIPAVGYESTESCKYLEQRGIPYVFCNRSDAYSSVPLVCSNDFYGGYIATKHLISVGYQRIAYVSPQRYKTSLDRYLGYASALLEAGFELDQNHVLMLTGETGATHRPDMGSIVENAISLLRGDNPPDSFFCFNDRTAMTIYQAIHRANKRISSDVGVIGYDNSDLCEAMETPLTSVCFGSYTIGQKAAEILDGELHGKRMRGNRVFVFQPELVIRQSCLGGSKK